MTGRALRCGRCAASRLRERSWFSTGHDGTLSTRGVHRCGARAARAGHVGRRPGLVEEDQSLGVRSSCPSIGSGHRAAVAADVGATPARQRDAGLFLSVTAMPSGRSGWIMPRCRSLERRAADKSAITKPLKRNVRLRRVRAASRNERLRHQASRPSTGGHARQAPRDAHPVAIAFTRTSAAHAGGADRRSRSRRLRDGVIAPGLNRRQNPSRARS